MNRSQTNRKDMRCSCGALVSVPRLTGLCDFCLERELWKIEREIAVENEINRQVYMMEHPEKWLKKPFLPLVRHERLREPGTGFLYLNPDVKPNLMPTVYLGVIYSIAAASVELRTARIARVRLLAHDEVMELYKVNYKTFASIVHDGWRVDE